MGVFFWVGGGVCWVGFGVLVGVFLFGVCLWFVCGGGGVVVLVVLGVSLGRGVSFVCGGCWGWGCSRLVWPAEQNNNKKNPTKHTHTATPKFLFFWFFWWFGFFCFVLCFVFVLGFVFPDLLGPGLEGYTNGGKYPPSWSLA